MTNANRSTFLTGNSNSIILISVLLIVGVAGRLGMDVPNFKPLGAVCLFAGLLFRDVRLALLIPLLIMLLSDFFLGFYEPALAIAVYGSLLLNVAIGRSAKNWIFGTQSSIGCRVAATLGLAFTSSLQFFILTNAAVGLFSGWYPVSYSGMSSCFVAALPFFRWTLAGDMLFFSVPVVASLVMQEIANRRHVAVKAL
jgi:hypothetical protein